MSWHHSNPGNKPWTAFFLNRSMASLIPSQIARAQSFLACGNRTLFPHAVCFGRRSVKAVVEAEAGRFMAATEGVDALPPSKLHKVEVEKENGVHVAAYIDVPPRLLVKRLSERAVLPTRGSAFAAGYDLSSAYDAVVPARGKAMIKTDLSIALPEQTYGRVAPRSGLAWKHSIDVGAGVVDCDYRGPLQVILFNFSDQDFAVKAGDRVAQLIVERIVTPEVVEVDTLSPTVRGEGGFGSTGVA